MTLEVTFGDVVALDIPVVNTGVGRLELPFGDL
jgi:hypothetical protein